MEPRKITTTKKSIKRYWYHRLKKMGKIKKTNRDHFLKKDHCFACLRSDKRVDRAHITADFIGGEDSPENLHLLCRGCHHQSETYRGEQYFSWFLKQNAMHSVIHDAARFSGVAMQAIFDIFIKDKMEALADSMGLEMSVEESEDVAAFVGLMKMMAVPSEKVQIKV